MNKARNLNNGGIKMRTIALLLTLFLASPALASGPWDGLRAQTDVYQAYEQTDHPPTGSAQAVSGHTLGVVGVPVYLATTTGWAGAQVWQELTGFWFVGYGMTVGPWLEARTAPSKVGKFEYNGHVVTGEAAKWERDPDHVGWNRLARYDTYGPGVDKAHDTGMAFDRIGG